MGDKKTAANGNVGERDRAKSLIQGLIEQFGSDQVNEAVFACGLGEIDSGSVFDSGLFDDEEDVPEDDFVPPDEDYDVTPVLDGATFITNALNEEAVKQAYGLDPVLFDPQLIVPLFMPCGIAKDKKGNLEGTGEVIKVGSRKDGCRYAVVDFGTRYDFDLKGKKTKVRTLPQVIVRLCKTDAAKAQYDVFKNAFDLSKQREMGGTTKPGGKPSRIKVSVGWQKGNAPIINKKKPNVWRAPDYVEKG